MYLLTKLWQLSILINFLYLKNFLTYVIINYWFKDYKVLNCDSQWYIDKELLILTFDVSEIGMISPYFLGCVFMTILNHPECVNVPNPKNLLLSVVYEGDARSLSKHFTLKDSTEPDDFIKHFLHLTDIQGHGESKTVLIHAQIVIVKVFKPIV